MAVLTADCRELQATVRTRGFPLVGLQVVAERAPAAVSLSTQRADECAVALEGSMDQLGERSSCDVGRHK